MSKVNIYLEDLLNELTKNRTIVVDFTGYTMIREFLEQTLEEGDLFLTTILGEDKIRITLP